MNEKIEKRKREVEYACYVFVERTLKSENTNNRHIVLESEINRTRME